jgi:hypothetical protein
MPSTGEAYLQSLKTYVGFDDASSAIGGCCTMNNPGKILVVDDHLDLAENLAEILEGGGYETTIAEKPVGLAQLLAWVEHALGKAPTRSAS